METADWRHYRNHLIVCRRSWFFALRRYEVWKDGQLLGTFRDYVRAELYIDAAVEQREDGSYSAASASTSKLRQSASRG